MSIDRRSFVVAAATAAAIRPARARIEVTVRAGQLRVAPALFNNAEEIEKCLTVTKQLV